MTRRWSSIRSLLFVMMIVSVFAVNAKADDTIEYTNNEGKKTIVRGKIDSEGESEVVLKANAGEKKIPVYQIDLIRYDKQPPEMATIRSKFGQGRYDELIEELTNLGKAVEGRQDGLQASIAYLLLQAKCEQAIQDLSKKDDALATADKMLANFRQTRHYYPAIEQKAKVLMAASDFVGAEKLFDEISKLDWPGFHEKGLLYKGICALQRGQTADAEKLFEEVLTSKAEGKIAFEQKMSASVFKAESVLKAGKAQDAEAMLRKSLEEVPQEAMVLRARGHNTLGDALLAQKKPKEALYDGYMWTVVLYNKSPDQLPRALFGAWKCCGAIGRKDDSKRFFDRLKAEYPNSTWTKSLGG